MLVLIAVVVWVLRLLGAHSGGNCCGDSGGGVGVVGHSGGDSVGGGAGHSCGDSVCGGGGDGCIFGGDYSVGCDVVGDYGVACGGVDSLKVNRQWRRVSSRLTAKVALSVSL